ncbi:hypothetical protein NEOLEDRAFT_1182802 [Neolentinus lepideus HHB14362 ss-1]|uniref:Uncharacterized protein n=1 Tax=Neolentinus lepideus HHB14362 ss-1 TaxID=1314782 RepID=A0A165NVV0_9AGAM|nr:hypothetical protein NEOLEDRAFT_1182802 [Neolentinus lepideus HHB14362 ss-1]
MALYRAIASLHRDLLDTPSEDDPSEEQDEGSDTPRKGKKRGCVPAGQDFWSCVAKFFREKAKEWGSDITGNPAWRSFIEQCIIDEKRLFPDDPIAILSGSEIGAVAGAAVAPVFSAPATAFRAGRFATAFGHGASGSSAMVPPPMPRTGSPAVATSAAATNALYPRGGSTGRFSGSRG